MIMTVSRRVLIKWLIPSTALGYSMRSISSDKIESTNNNHKNINEVINTTNIESKNNLNLIIRNMLKGDNANPGDLLLGVRQDLDGAILRTQHEKNAETLSVEDAGAKGDSKSDDTEAFKKYEKWVKDSIVDLNGRSYNVQSIPTGNKYTNGYFIFNDTSFRTIYNPIRTWSNIVSIGENSLSKFSPDRDTHQSLIVIGKNAAYSAIDAKSGGIILGEGAHENSLNIPYQTIAIGKGSLANVQPDSSDLKSVEGNRNIGIGAYTGLFTTSGYQNVLVGRNTGSNITTGARNTAIGTGSMKGSAPVSLSGKVACENELTGSENTAIGYNSLMNVLGDHNTALGSKTGQNVKIGKGNTFIGSLAAYNIGSNSAFNNLKLISRKKEKAKYRQNGKTIEIKLGSRHPDNAIGSINITFVDGINSKITKDPQTFNNIVIKNNGNISVQSPVEANSFGNCIINWITSDKSDDNNDFNTFNGFCSAYDMLYATGTTSIGSNTARGVTISENSTFVGNQAGTLSIDSSEKLKKSINVTAIGSRAIYTGDNQVQLGDSETTVYYYQLSQRSDLRDKANVRDTHLGLNFINKLRFVDFKWNFREDYSQQLNDAHESIKENDGSKTRLRWHHGVIAQDIGKLLSEIGINSGIHQDHLHNGGSDVQSVSYNELISPLGKSIQELSTLVDELKEEILELKSKISRMGNL